jgi:hypothetical protein
LKEQLNYLTGVITTAAFQQFACWMIMIMIIIIIIITDVNSLSENLFGQQKKTKNVTVVTYGSVVPHKLTVITEHTPTHNSSKTVARTPSAIKFKSVSQSVS